MMSRKGTRTSVWGIADPSLRVARPAVVDLKGKTVAVVGGTDGIGAALARAAAKNGANVLVVGRTLRDPGAKVTHIKADLSSMAEASRVGRELPSSLDVRVLHCRSAGLTCICRYLCSQLVL